MTSQSRRHNLPAQSTPLIGRDREVAAACDYLRRDDVRLLTLTGPPGVGKTRLALQVALELAGTMADGVCFVPLAPINDPALVPANIAQSLGLGEVGGQSHLDHLKAALRDSQLLLVLDNCEQVTAAAPIIAELLAAAPHLKGLITSRAAIHLSGEHEFPLSPLPLPERDQLDIVLDSPAAALFVQRAHAVRPDFELTEANAAVVAQICRRLDGLPLAIELAAARSKLFPPRALLARLTSRLSLLIGGAQDLPARQRTLRGAIDWSYSLLDPAEQRLFRCLAIFVGGWTLDAAEALCAEWRTGSQEEQFSILDGLASLLDKSLVRQIGGDDAEPRFTMLELIREFGLERLHAAGEEEEVSRRHGAYFVELAEAAEPELVGADQLAWFDRLEADHDNIRAAMRRALERGDPGTAARISGAIWHFWLIRGHLTEGRRWLEATLAELTDQPAMRGKVLGGAGLLATRQGDHTRAMILVTERLAVQQAVGEKFGLAEAWHMLGTTTLDRGHRAQAADYFAQALPHYRQIRVEQGATAATQRRAERGAAMVLNHLSLIAHEEGDNTRAARLSDESTALFRVLGDTRSLAAALANQGLIALDRGDNVQAAALGAESLGLRQILGDKGGSAHVLTILARVALARGDTRQAAAHYAEALMLRRETDDGGGMAVCLAGLASSAAGAGDLPRATHLLAAAHRLGLPPASTDGDGLEILAALRRDLDPERFATAWATGEALTLDQAIALALNLLEDAAPSASEPGATPPADAPTATPLLRIYALGPVRVRRADQELTPADWTYARAKELLFYLLSYPSRTKEQIGLVFWPDASPGQLRSNLHPIIHHLRRALGRQDWIIFARDSYAFNRALPHWFDVEAFTALLAEARQAEPGAPAEVVRLLEEAIALYSGDFLADSAGGDWYLPQREALRRDYQDALLALGRLHVAAGHDDRAAAIYRRAIVHDTSLEVAHRELMQCYARRGERGRALRHYQSLVKTLHDEFAAAPEPRTTALYEQLRHGAAS